MGRPRKERVSKAELMLGVPLVQWTHFNRLQELVFDNLDYIWSDPQEDPSKACLSDTDMSFITKAYAASQMWVNSGEILGNTDGKKLSHARVQGTANDRWLNSFTIQNRCRSLVMLGWYRVQISNRNKWQDPPQIPDEDLGKPWPPEDLPPSVVEKLGLGPSKEPVLREIDEAQSREWQEKHERKKSEFLERQRMRTTDNPGFVTTREIQDYVQAEALGPSSAEDYDVENKNYKGVAQPGRTLALEMTTKLRKSGWVVPFGEVVPRKTYSLVPATSSKSERAKFVHPSKAEEKNLLFFDAVLHLEHLLYFSAVAPWSVLGPHDMAEDGTMHPSPFAYEYYPEPIGEFLVNAMAEFASLDKKFLSLEGANFVLGQYKTTDPPF